MPSRAPKRPAGRFRLPADSGGNGAEVEPQRHWANPFLLALWVLSAAFIGGGLYLLRYIGDRLDSLNTAGGGNSSDYYLLQAYTVGAPALIVLGLATATGTIFLFAVRAMRG